MIALLKTGWQIREPMWFALGLLIFITYLIRHRQRVAMTLASTQIWSNTAGTRSAMPKSWRQRCRTIPLILEVLALSAFVTAIARPVLVESDPPDRLGRDVLLCFDRSSSMAALDLDPAQSRLTVGKQLAGEFLQRRVDDRLGIVTFARYADLVCPPTLDHNAVTELLGSVALVDSEGSEDATAIGAAIGMAANLLQRTDSASKVIILLTDGEENVATSGDLDQIAPLHAGQWCRDHGIRVHTIALGRGEQSADGAWRPIDTTAMQQLAKITGGRFYPAADSQTLRSVYAEIDQLETAQFAEPGIRVTECFGFPAVAGLLLLMLSHIWRHSRLAVMA